MKSVRNTKRDTFYAASVAIVTGAGSGIGLALATALAEQGATVILSDVDPRRTRDATRTLSDRGYAVTGVPLDVRDAAAFQALVDDVVRRHGRIDYLFNNAGICVGGPTHHHGVDDWKKVIDVNLYGVVNGVTAAYPLMVRQGHGHIVNTGSVEGLCPFPATVSYAASKHGVVGLSHSLRVEGAAFGVKVSVVCPGYVSTRIFEDSKTVGVDRDAMLGTVPPAWLGVTPEECARIVLDGVRRNKDTIVVTALARACWTLNRIHPPLMQGVMKVAFGLAKGRMKMEV